MSDYKGKALPIVITNEQKKDLIDALHTLVSVGQDVAERFCEENGGDVEEEKLTEVAEVITLGLIAFPWAVALNVWVEEDDEKQIKAAWSLAEFLGSEFAEIFQDILNQEDFTTH